MTTPERWAHIERMLDELLDLPPEARLARLDALAGDDAALRANVRALLEEEARPGPLDGSLATMAGALFEDEPPSRAGHTIGPYRVLGELGRGGMGEVFLAERVDGEFEQRVALKVVRAAGPGGELAERFRHERQILARLRHPHIASLYDGGTADDGTLYFAMEVVEGTRITDYAEAARLDVDSRIRLFESVCEAVSHAHRHLVVHRDLKPANVLVTSTGTVKLLDFGIAKILDPDAPDATQTTRAFLTPAYATPEQLRGAAATTATDVYALGVLLYELLTGRHPHGDTARSADVIRAILETEPADVDRSLRGDLDNILRKALRKRPEDRYASVDDLRADLERYRHSLPVSARPPTAAYRLRKFARRHRLGVAVGATACLSLIVFAVSMSLLYVRADRALARAVEAEAAAEREAETAKQVSDFLVGVFRTSNPEESAWEDVTARDLLERAVRDIDTRLSERPLVRARLLGSMGHVYVGLGRYTEARPLLEGGLELRRAHGNDTSGDFAMALDAYASLLQRQADYDAALAAHREALAVGRAALGEAHPRVALFTMSLGTLYRNLGELDSALVYATRSVALHRAAFGPEHRAVGTALYNEAAVYLDREDAGSARPLFEEAHRIWAAAYGESHMRTVSALGAIAGAMNLSGDPEGARDVQRRVVTLHEETLGDGHPELGLSLLNLARLERTLGDTEAARRAAERARAVLEPALGADHPRMSEVLGVLADVRSDEGDPAAARELAARALGILDAAALRTPDTIDQLERLATLERTLGDEATARAHLARALSVAESVFDADHATVRRLRAEAAGDASSAPRGRSRTGTRP